MYCKNCGIELSGKEKFCPGCGTAVTVSDTTRRSRKKKMSGKGRSGLLLLLPLILIAGIAATAVLLVNGKKVMPLIRIQNAWKNTADQFAQQFDNTIYQLVPELFEKLTDGTIRIDTANTVYDTVLDTQYMILSNDRNEKEHVLQIGTSDGEIYLYLDKEGGYLSNSRNPENYGFSFSTFAEDLQTALSSTYQISEENQKGIDICSGFASYLQQSIQKNSFDRGYLDAVVQLFESVTPSEEAVTVWDKNGYAEKEGCKLVYEIEKAKLIALLREWDGLLSDTSGIWLSGLLSGDSDVDLITWIDENFSSSIFISFYLANESLQKLEIMTSFRLDSSYAEITADINFGGGTEEIVSCNVDVSVTDLRYGSKIESSLNASYNIVKSTGYSEDFLVVNCNENEQYSNGYTYSDDYSFSVTNKRNDGSTDIWTVITYSHDYDSNSEEFYSTLDKNEGGITLEIMAPGSGGGSLKITTGNEIQMPKEEAYINLSEWPADIVDYIFDDVIPLRSTLLGYPSRVRISD